MVIKNEPTQFILFNQHNIWVLRNVNIKKPVAINSICPILGKMTVLKGGYVDLHIHTKSDLL